MGLSQGKIWPQPKRVQPAPPPSPFLSFMPLPPPASPSPRVPFPSLRFLLWQSLAQGLCFTPVLPSLNPVALSASNSRCVGSCHAHPRATQRGCVSSAAPDPRACSLLCPGRGRHAHSLPPAFSLLPGRQRCPSTWSHGQTSWDARLLWGG